MPDLWLAMGLFGVFAISFLGSGPFPLPLTAVVMWLGQFHIPVLVVLSATAGTLLGWLCLEGVLRRWVFRHPEATRKIPVAYQKFFLRRTGFWLFIFNALPFPLDFIRFLALLNNYDRKRLLVILTISRLIRNTSLVLVGAALAQHQALLWGTMVAVMVVPLLIGKLLALLPKPAVE
jgi:hypothetical protein